jgi:predicted acyl esterase
MATVVAPHRSEVRDGMRVDWHVGVPMDDAAVLDADVFRPVADGRYPVVLSHGPYAKGLAFQDGYPVQWEKLVAEHPEVVRGSSNRYQSWEVVDPERWVPEGYAVVRVDSRGAGWSPGSIDVWSPRETRDLYECIEWAAKQPWSSGKVGLSGISYYAMNEWQVAGLAPPHLAAMIAWEGAADFYRDVYYHGGILCQFACRWYPRQVESVQYGVGERGKRSAVTGEPVAGPATRSPEELARDRVDLCREIKAHPLDDEWYLARSADWPHVRTPFLSAANWGGQGLHPRGNFEAFIRAASTEKWLEVHGGEHWTSFYTDEGISMQKRFFARHLKGDTRAWAGEPRVRLQVRHVGRFVERAENEWPLARTRWTRYYLDPAHESLRDAAPPASSSAAYDAGGHGLTLRTPPFERETEVTGPLAATLFVSSSTTDADLFLVVRLFDPKGNEVVFQGALDPNTPIAQGWLRASHRKLDPALTRAYRPYHAHDEIQPLEPGRIYELDVEIWPTCIVVPHGYTLALTVRGSDYEYEGDLGEFARRFAYASKGCGPFLHADPDDRTPERRGRTTVHGGGEHASYLLLPIIP